MEILPPNQDELIRKITNEFIDKINHTQTPNLGVFNALKIISQQGELWELSILLSIAENEPVKSETIANELESIISKSTVYRKINHFIDTKLIIKDHQGYLHLDNSLQSLGIIAKLRTLQKK